MCLEEPLLDKEQPKSNLKKILIACAIVLGIVTTIILIIVLQPSEQKTVVVQEQETRKFEVLTLDNGLEVMMIHNNNSLEEQAYCSISIPAGFLHENGITGLSHLLEHVAFDQTITKSGERNLFNFIKSKGGDFNAFTGQEETNYYFNINNDSLLESLDILVQFLKTPSLIEIDVNREVKIVEEEWQYFAADYNWVEQLIYYQNSNPSSNLKHTGTGNAQSFVKDFQNRSVSLTQEMNNFFNKFYSGSKMKFAVHSTHNSDNLKEQLEDKLGSIPQRGQDEDFEINQVPFRQQENQRIFFIENTEERSDLSIFFAIEKDQDDYKTQT